MRETLDFLRRLDKNNNREWFQSNKSNYERSYLEMQNFAEQLIAEMNNYDQIETASGKKSLFRIYRDVRFGKDKTPYKTNWGGFLKRATRSLRGGYYYQVGIHGSFVMGGFFGPNAQDLLHIRKQIAQDAEPLRTILDSQSFKEFFGQMEGSRLKTAPKGFERDHPEIDLLRYKQFILRHDFTTKEVLSKDFPEKMAVSFNEMRPFLDYMSDILTTDLNGEPLF